MIKVCVKCQKKFEYIGRNHWIVIYCSDKCRWQSSCQKYYRRHLESERMRKLANYHRKKKTEEGLKEIRKTNYKANSKRRFGVDNRKEIVKKFNSTCVFCGKQEEKICIHHLDNKGRRNKNPNNDIKNLVTCCHSCHAKIHWHKQNLQMKI